MFMLPLPAIPPKFVYDENLIKLKTIMNFLLPPKPDHPDILGRLWFNMEIWTNYGLSYFRYAYAVIAEKILKKY